MKTNPESPDQELVNKLLADESWDAINAQLKKDGLSALRVRRLERRIILAVTSSLAALFLGLSAWFLFPKTPLLQQAKSVDITITPNAETTAPDSKLKMVNDEELLALFKDRSCVLAEVNGKKTLVFLDSEPASPQ